MKNLLIILSFLTMIGNAMAKKEKELKAPFIGSWKFTNQTVVNDFQKVKQYKLQNQYESEYFIFESIPVNFCQKVENNSKTLSISSSDSHCK